MKEPSPRCCSAIRAFTETDIEPPVDLAFAFVSDEEVGGDANLLLLLEADRLEADACVIGEPTCRGGRHSRDGRRSGSIWLTLRDQRGAHGSRPVLGENAIDRLYDAVTTLRERFGTRRLEVDHAIEPIIDESIAFYEPTMGAETAREPFERPDDQPRRPRGRGGDQQRPRVRPRGGRYSVDGRRPDARRPRDPGLRR